MRGEAEPEPVAHLQVSHVNGEEGGQQMGELEAGAQAPGHSSDGEQGFLSLVFSLTAAVLGIIHIIYHLLKMCDPGLSDVFMGLCRYHHSI